MQSPLLISSRRNVICTLFAGCLVAIGTYVPPPTQPPPGRKIAHEQKWVMGHTDPSKIAQGR